MSNETELFYIYSPTEPRQPKVPIEFLSVGDFLAEESACRVLWEMVSSQFRTRSKFLAVWSGVRFVAVHRDEKGNADGFLLVNAPVNWQIDYVVVRPSARGKGIGAALVAETLDQAYRRRVPFVTLTSKPKLRPLYEACGFVVAEPKGDPVACEIDG
ncbi:MAG TPA: GNAT family N-acetyltransferase [Gemmata sp.]|nr:GNAT family N-acetyltransferase [Gemmata sp.]